MTTSPRYVPGVRASSWRGRQVGPGPPRSTITPVISSPSTNTWATCKSPCERRCPWLELQFRQPGGCGRRSFGGKDAIRQEPLASPSRCDAISSRLRPAMAAAALCAASGLRHRRRPRRRRRGRRVRRGGRLPSPGGRRAQARAACAAELGVGIGARSHGLRPRRRCAPDQRRSWRTRHRRAGRAVVMEQQRPRPQPRRPLSRDDHRLSPGLSRATACPAREPARPRGHSCGYGRRAHTVVRLTSRSSSAPKPGTLWPRPAAAGDLAGRYAPADAHQDSKPRRRGPRPRNRKLDRHARITLVEGISHQHQIRIIGKLVGWSRMSAQTARTATWLAAAFKVTAARGERVDVVRGSPHGQRPPPRRRDGATSPEPDARSITCCSRPSPDGQGGSGPSPAHPARRMPSTAGPPGWSVPVFCSTRCHTLTGLRPGTARFRTSGTRRSSVSPPRSPSLRPRCPLLRPTAVQAERGVLRHHHHHGLRKRRRKMAQVIFTTA